MLSARIDLQRLRHIILGNPFVKTGILTLVDRNGREVFDGKRLDLSDRAIVAMAKEQLASNSRSLGVAPYARPNGEVMLGAYDFPRPFKWALLAELPQRDAYMAVEKMTRSLLLWGFIGLLVAILGAIILALTISRPILELDRVAIEVAKGNFAVRVVRGVRLNDEIGELARRMNEMVVGLAERLQLEKFVSGGTMAAIRVSEEHRVRLGGTRQRATMLFADIRGYTNFAEEHEPDVVIEVLNFYFEHLTKLVKDHGGDVDKFVGDQILAVFQGVDAETNAVCCALAMQAKMRALSADRPIWNLTIGVGINTGEVIIGAMGSQERMDFTVLGREVNLAARLCSTADPGQILISEDTRRALTVRETLDLRALPALHIKGKSKAVPVYQVTANEMLPIAAGQ
jgi:adenylate cyclase